MVKLKFACYENQHLFTLHSSIGKLLCLIFKKEECVHGGRRKNLRSLSSQNLEGPYCIATKQKNWKWLDTHCGAPPDPRMNSDSEQLKIFVKEQKPAKG